MAKRSKVLKGANGFPPIRELRGDGTETCRCDGAPLNGNDHCPACFCEQFESFCDEPLTAFKVTVELTVLAVDVESARALAAEFVSDAPVVFDR